MSWWNPGGIFTGGIDLEAEQVRGEALDNQRYELNQETYTPEQWAIYQSHIQAPDSAYGTDVGSAVGDSFIEGAQDGLNNVKGGIKGTLNGVGSFVWGAIPWWVWPVAIVGLFIWLGGLTLLKGKLAKA